MPEVDIEKTPAGKTELRCWGNNANRCALKKSKSIFFSRTLRSRTLRSRTFRSRTLHSRTLRSRTLLSLAAHHLAEEAKRNNDNNERTQGQRQYVHARERTCSARLGVAHGRNCAVNVDKCLAPPQPERLLFLQIPRALPRATAVPRPRHVHSCQIEPRGRCTRLTLQARVRRRPCVLREALSRRAYNRRY